MQHETATLAGGCFWGMEELIRQIPGVLDTTVGYTGGDVADPTYDIVKLGNTNHAESVQILFDPEKMSFKELLHFFFRIHDPTTQNRQGHDVGTQYRSVIFYHSLEQKEVAEAVIKEVDCAKRWATSVVTEVIPASTFYSAEDDHQDYLKKNPAGYTCHWIRD